MHQQFRLFKTFEHHFYIMNQKFNKKHIKNLQRLVFIEPKYKYLERASMNEVPFEGEANKKSVWMLRVLT